MTAPLAPVQASAPRARDTRTELFVRRGLLVVAGASALTAVLAGLTRIGVPLAWGPSVSAIHGPLFVLAVFGTVISLERAVAVARWWSLVAPGAVAAASIAMIAGLGWAPWLATVGALALVGVNAFIVRRQRAPFTWLMLIGSLALAFGNLSWALRVPVFEVIHAWVAFFVLTIVAERLEMSRLTPTPRWAGNALIAVALAFAVVSCTATWIVDVAHRFIGLCMVLIAAWQARFDLARLTVRTQGLARFAALGVLAAAFWLFVTGAVTMLLPMPPAGPLYDAELHGVFVGYVLSMVFAHAPIILPSVAKIALPYHPALLVALCGLHLSVALRVAGDLLPNAALRQAGAIGNALALVAFVVAALWARARAR
ncbi:MAG: hypothetical protein IT383_25080 [Deltaproteobacteria bacterium]|nr:hypothetical protein [Deltaproteobacteria bacterium]